MINVSKAVGTFILSVLASYPPQSVPLLPPPPSPHHVLPSGIGHSVWHQKISPLHMPRQCQPDTARSNCRLLAMLVASRPGRVYQSTTLPHPPLPSLVGSSVVVPQECQGSRVAYRSAGLQDWHCFSVSHGSIRACQR